MLTLVFETTQERAEALARVHLPEDVPMPQFRVTGRLVAVQSDFFALMGKGAIESLALTFGLPLRAVVDRPVFGEEPSPPRRSMTVRQQPRSKPRRNSSHRPRLALLPTGDASD